jgi:Saxitoxin biosynthesis operon protein SxtJ
MSTHEDFSRHAEAKGSSDRAFGFVFAIFFSLVGLAPLRTHHSVRWWALTLALLFLAVALLRPVWLNPFNRLWTKLGLLLGRVVSPIVMGLLFFLVVTPTAFLFRLLGKDPLRLAPEPDASTYWIERRPPGPPPETMANQF